MNLKEMIAAGEVWTSGFAQARETGMNPKEATAIQKAKRLVQLDLNKEHEPVPGVAYRASPTTGKLRPIKPKVKRRG